MKALALLAFFAIPTGTLGFAASSHGVSDRASMSHVARVVRYPAIMHLSVRGGDVLFQTGSTSATATPGTPVPTGTPVAQPSATTTTYPDPVTILRNTILVYQQVTSARYELVTDADKQNVEKVHLDAKGDVTCTGPGLKGTIVGTDTLEGTAQVQHLKLSYVELKKKAWIKGKSTKGVWKSTAQSTLSDLGISVNNLLLCPNSASSGSGSSGSSDQIKNLVNLGPDTFQGVAVWHIQATDVTTDSSGNPVNATLDFFISQDHFLPYKITFTSDAGGVNLVQTQILTKFGEKIKIKKPKVGSK